MRAIILAAGQGSRLAPLTLEVPKALLRIGDATIVERSVNILNSLGVENISIVVGYLKEKFFETFGDRVKYYENNDYEKTDQLGSLLMAQPEFNASEDVLVMTGDLFCSKSVYCDLIEHTAPLSVVINTRDRLYDDTIEKVLLENGKMRQIGKLNVLDSQANAEFMGITKIRESKTKDFIEAAHDSYIQNQNKGAVIHVVQRFIDNGNSFSHIESDKNWCEIDDLNDLKKAEEIFLAYPDY